MPIRGVIIKDFKTIIDAGEIEGACVIYIFLLKCLQLWDAGIINLLLFCGLLLGGLAVGGEDDSFLFGRALLIGHSL
jgi:hypothetical protein